LSTCLQANWKKLETPSIGRWLKEIAINMSLEKITHIKSRYRAFEDAWKSFMCFLEKENNGVISDGILEDM